MTLATSLLGGVGKEVGSIMLQDMMNAFWPKQKEVTVKEDIAALSVKMDSIGQDAAYLRIQPVKDKLIEKLDYYQNTFIPFVAKQAQSPEMDLDLVKKYHDCLNQYSRELRATLEQALAVLNERSNTCDYPTRCLFEIIQALISLRIAYMSWQYFLMLKLSIKKSEIELLQDDYKKFVYDYAGIILPKVDSLLKSRLDKTTFTRDSKTRIEKDGSRYIDVLESASYEYKDNFSSAYSNDPYRGDSFRFARNEELKWYDISFKEDLKEQAIARTYAEANKYEQQYKNHKIAITNLHNSSVRDPAVVFSQKLNTVPAELK